MEVQYRHVWLMFHSFFTAWAQWMLQNSFLSQHLPHSTLTYGQPICKRVPFVNPFQICSQRESFGFTALPIPSMLPSFFLLFSDMYIKVKFCNHMQKINIHSNLEIEGHRNEDSPMFWYFIESILMSRMKKIASISFTSFYFYKPTATSKSVASFSFSRPEMPERIFLH